MCLALITVFRECWQHRPKFLSFIILYMLFLPKENTRFLAWIGFKKTFHFISHLFVHDLSMAALVGLKNNYNFTETTWSQIVSIKKEDFFLISRSSVATEEETSQKPYFACSAILANFSFSLSCFACSFFSFSIWMLFLLSAWMLFLLSSLALSSAVGTGMNKQARVQTTNLQCSFKYPSNNAA